MVTTYDFSISGDNYYAEITLDENNRSKNISMNMSSDNKITQCSKNIQFIFKWRRASYQQNGNNYIIGNSGWVEINSGSKTGNPSSSTSTNWTYNLSNNDFVKYSYNNDYWLTQFYLSTKDVFFPSSSTININISSNICCKFDLSSKGFMLGNCKAYKAYTSTYSNIGGDFSRNTTYYVLSTETNQEYLSITAKAGSDSKSTTISPNENWYYTYEEYSWAVGQPGTSSRRYRTSSTVIIYKNGNQVATAYDYNESSSPYPSAPSWDVYVYPRTNNESICDLIYIR